MRRSPVPFWLLLPCLLAGCGLLFAPSPLRSRSFVLTPISTATPPAADAALSLSIEPVRLPTYLERSEMVTRVAANELRPSALDRWAEPLDASFTRTLAQNLAALLGTERVIASLWYGKQTPSFRVAVGVECFEASSDGAATLVARWALKRGIDDAIVVVRESRHTHAVAADSTAAAVEALSACLADLSRDIAAAIETARRETTKTE